MTRLEEGDLLITFPEGADGRKFDGPEHGLSHCMKALDWIFELKDRTYFIELKDLDVRNARAHKDPALLQNQRESLQRKLPTGIPKVWRRPIAEDCLVFNIKTWNETFPEFPLARTPAPDLGGSRP